MNKQFRTGEGFPKLMENWPEEAEVGGAVSDSMPSKMASGLRYTIELT